MSSCNSEPHAGEVSRSLRSASSTTLQLTPPEPGTSPEFLLGQRPVCECQASAQARIWSLEKLWSGWFILVRCSETSRSSEPPAGKPRRPSARASATLNQVSPHEPGIGPDCQSGQSPLSAKIALTQAQDLVLAERELTVVRRR